MSSHDLFEGDEALLDESDDSFIVQSDAESDGSMASKKADHESDYEFLFGSEAPTEEKKTKKSASKWQRELDRRLREASAQFMDAENIESEVAFSLQHLSVHFERRQGVESEMLSLFSGLLTREQFTMDASPTAATEATAKADIPETDVAMAKMMKKLIRQTFRGRAPEGRFGGFSRAPEDVNKPVSSSKVSTVTTIGKDALSNLQDLNTLLSREREGDYVELDGVPLYKHTRYGTLYVFENNFITTYILPLCSKLLRESHGADYDSQALTQEVVYLLYQLSQPPSEAWYNYWTEAQPHYRAMSTSREYENDPQVSMELKRRARIVWHYLNGMVLFRSALMSSDLWTLVGEFRLKLEKFERAGCRTEERKQRVEFLQQLQNELADERDRLLAEADGSNDEDEDVQVVHGRLKKDHSAAEARKKRIQELRERLFNVNEELAKERESHMVSQQQTRVHFKTVRLLIFHILTVPGDGLGILCMLQESGLLSLLKDEIISCFMACKRGFTVSDTGEITAHAAYLSEQQRETLWEHVRLVHALLVCLDIGKFLSLLHKGVKPEEMQISEELLRSHDDFSNRNADDESFLDLMRLNPKLARLTLRGSTQLGKFVINARLTGARNHSNYDHWFRFPTLSHLQTPFEVMCGVSSKSQGGSFSLDVLRSLQSELHSLVGIDGEFEHCHWSEGSEGAELYYELGLMLSLCLVDLAREAQDRYYLSSDYQVVFDLHSMVVTYYRCLYLYTRDSCRLESRKPPPQTYVLLALRRYIGSASMCGRVSCAYLWQLIRKHSMSKSSHVGATSALRAFFADLCLMHMFGSLDDNLHVLKICQDTLTSYFLGDIRAVIFWILRYFKPLSHSINLFAFTLSSLHLLRKVLSSLGSVSFTQENMRAESLGYDADSDSSEDGTSAVKTVVVTSDAVFTSRNRNTVSDDILYNGRVVYNCISMLASFRTNSVHLNDLLISHLEAVPTAMLYDIKYFYVFRDVISDKRVWQNARWRWIGDFCAHVLESFFDSWLGRSNRFLPVELFFNKSSPATKGPFRPCARENIMPITRGYERCELLNELLRRPDATVYEVSKEMRGGTPGGAWDADEDAALLQYHKQFMFLDDPISYIAELLGRRTSDVLKRLQELRVSGDDSGARRGGTASHMRQLLGKLVSEFADEAIRVCAELHENISESLEMQKLGGAEAVCEVMEPLSASPRILESAEFQALLRCLGISQKWLLPKDTSAIGPLMEVLGDPVNYIGVGQDASSHPPADIESDQPFVDDPHAPTVVTSRDIAQLILDLTRCLERNNEAMSISDLVQSGITLLESASVIGKAECVFEGLPQNDECISKLAALLRTAGIEVNPPMLTCSSLPDEAVALDRLKVSLNLCKLPQERLEAIVNSYVQTRPAERQESMQYAEGDDFDDSMEHHLDLDEPITLNISRPSKAKAAKKPQAQRATTKGKLKRPGQKLDDRDPGIRAALDELRSRLSRGETRVSAADLMGVGSFANWDEAFAGLRNACESLGALEESVDGALWLTWPADRIADALSQMSKREKRRDSSGTTTDFGVRCLSGASSLDISAFERLEISRNLVASLYSESLRLAQEGQLENAVKSREHLKKYVD
ncbi:hypothetical protein X943_002666 [Babesia divergens]|uniref:Uncharacterized protein n=1 Tax=Babesia divergens TaxID=32595 RepID=A0AAD9G9L5_BABDI|nr:hypothetical protein X943_002666 [Babesia divergens]